MSQSTTVSQATKVACLIVFGFVLGLIYSLSGSQETVKEPTLGAQLSELNNKDQVTGRHKMGIVGGLGAVREKDAEVEEVVAIVKPQLEEKTNTKYESIEVISYKHQVVAGKNFFVKARVKPEGGEPKIAHLRIYRDIQQNVELSAFQFDKAEHDEIVYFQ